ncbi:MAG: DUF72 domain-containing protein [Bdellovibrionales bacterium]
MEFGKLANVNHVDWAIPNDDPLTSQFLVTLGSTDELKVYWGAPAWGHKEWNGKIYPEKTKSTDFLYHYSRYFSCVELNTTHYRIPSPEQTQKWLAQVPKGFLFCPKVFKGISHAARGLTDRKLLAEWFSFLDKLKDTCGPCFLQLPPYFEYAHKAELFYLLKNWPVDFELTLEFRHPSWFERGRIRPALTQYLQQHGVGLVITDVAGRRDVLHTSISADYAMLRFIGNELHSSDFERTRNWCRRFSTWEQQGLKRLFLFIHEPDDLLTPEMAHYFLEQLRAVGGWNVQPVMKSMDQLSLST